MPLATSVTHGTPSGGTRLSRSTVPFPDGPQRSCGRPPASKTPVTFTPTCVRFRPRHFTQSNRLSAASTGAFWGRIVGVETAVDIGIDVHRWRCTMGTRRRESETRLSSASAGKRLEGGSVALKRASRALLLLLAISLFFVPRSDVSALTATEEENPILRALSRAELVLLGKVKSPPELRAHAYYPDESVI